ncbi:MAG TPA: heme oxygenase [Methylophaga aminisulfidivorans]|uniref:Heme oxygenase n=2 Tax=root TaxID=1 RepID=A0A7C1VRT8_9GAMM|nr:heme oxygenase [Methylophaga aminisulfidivorans]
MTDTQAVNLSLALRERTHDLHEILDKRVMQLNPFADTAHYGGFLRMQLRLHAAAEWLYHDENMVQLIPDLKNRSRLNAVQHDCDDLGVPKTEQHIDLNIADSVDIGTIYQGIGWLYALEGSTLGAAMLLKHVKHQLNLSETHGASHMAAHNDGRATHWKQFKAMLDALPLTPEQREQALTGATQAFIFVTRAVNEVLVFDAVEAN